MFPKTEIWGVKDLSVVSAKNVLTLVSCADFDKAEPAGEVLDFYTAIHKNIPAGISGCRKNRLNNGTFF